MTGCFLGGFLSANRFTIAGLAVSETRIPFRFLLIRLFPEGGGVKKAIILAICAAVFLSACGPGQLFGPTLTPVPTSTAISTATVTSTSTPTSMPTSTLTPTPTPRPVVGPLEVGGIDLLLTSTGMEYETCHIRFLVVHLVNGGKCLSVNGKVSAGSLEKAAAIDFSQWTVRMDDQYQGVYTGSGPEALSWVFILPAIETKFIINFPGAVNADLSPIID